MPALPAPSRQGGGFPCNKHKEGYIYCIASNPPDCPSEERAILGTEVTRLVIGMKRWVGKKTVPAVPSATFPAMGESRLLPVCICCRETPAGGIRDGLVLYGRFLCSACEQEIALLSIANPRYLFFRERIREFLHGYFLVTGPLP
jgi:hypothetical protein